MLLICKKKMRGKTTAPDPNPEKHKIRVQHSDLDNQ